MLGVVSFTGKLLLRQFNLEVGFSSPPFNEFGLLIFGHRSIYSESPGPVVDHHVVGMRQGLVTSESEPLATGKLPALFELVGGGDAEHLIVKLFIASSGPQHRRYSLAHEIGHFLCNRHRPIQDTNGGFRCSKV